jgi:phosphoserine phosphatase RsbU/P
MSGVPAELLLVEDNPGDARLISEYLRETPHLSATLHHAGTLADARAFLARRAPDAILLDLELPDSSGLDTLAACLEAAPDAAVVVLTGIDEESLASRAVNEGAQDYLSKGETSAALLGHTLRYALERKRRENDRRRGDEAVMHARGEVLGVVAHDLRNPLSAIRMYAHLLSETAAEPESVRLLGAIDRLCDDADRLIQDLLDTTRIRAGHLRVEPVPVEVEALLTPLEPLHRAAAEKGVTLHTGAAGGPVRVYADPRRIQQVLCSLVCAAIDRSPPGTRVAVEVAPSPGGARFSVSDSGPGLEAEEREHLFRAAATGCCDPRGGGIALVIARGIVEEHGDSLQVASDARGGSTFSFALPAVTEDAAPADDGRAAAGAPAPDTARSTPLRVLLVDDHPAIRRGVAEVLRSRTTVQLVGEAETGEAAVELAKRTRPDVILMDLHLPGISGLEATRRIVADQPHVRVIALTADTADEALLPLLEAGGHGFVRKTEAHRDVLKALEAVARGEVALPPGATGLLADAVRARTAAARGLAGFEARDLKIVALTAEGYTSREIGKKLYLAKATVDAYRGRIMKRLGLEGRAELVQWALQKGLLSAADGAEQAGPRTAAR